MPEIKGEAVADVPTPIVGKEYTIMDAEQFRSQVHSYEGYRVTLKDDEGNEVVETLWSQDVYGPNSKIGAYVAALGKNTDDWKGKRIRYNNWAEGARRVEVLPPPS